MQQEGYIESLTQKELDVIEVIKLAFRSLKKTWAQSLPVPAVASFLYGLATYEYSLGATSAALENPDQGPQAFSALYLESLGISVAMGLLLSLSMIFPLRAAVRASGLKTLENSSLGLQALFLLLITVIISVTSTVGLVFCIVPGIAVAIAFSLSPASLVLDDAGPGKALANAYRTFSVRKSKVLALVLLLGLVTGLICFIAMLPALAYYIYALIQVIVTNQPELLLNVMQTYIMLIVVGIAISLPFSVALAGHTLVLAYANFRNFMPVGPEF
ncbi:MAG TPA: hypothetical protein DEA96_02045 [Leptospiraceae bacterium]|nr:hypothetical protein [Spirochaetaceae bacterium]HBS03716.1 hypothetical protein [Leptospiraceae bacterium]|tara:strand:+ start:250 stop:1068 length:819 start_codon:yes stop_codon:yes gene_type:complete